MARVGAAQGAWPVADDPNSPPLQLVSDHPVPLHQISLGHKKWSSPGSSVHREVRAVLACSAHGSGVQCSAPRTLCFRRCDVLYTLACSSPPLQRAVLFCQQGI
ncbi:hypothetical protein VPH35_051706 [Triticum aestivum]